MSHNLFNSNIYNNYGGHNYQNCDFGKKTSTLPSSSSTARNDSSSFTNIATPFNQLNLEDSQLIVDDDLMLPNTENHSYSILTNVSLNHSQPVQSIEKDQPIRPSITTPSTSTPSTSTPSNSTRKAKRSRRSYSLQKKLEVIDVYKANDGDINVTQELTNVDKKLITDWVKNQEAINLALNKNTRRRINGGGRPVLSPELDRLLLVWVRSQRTNSAKSCITLNMLKNQAKDIGNTLPNMESFRASHKFINSFMHRNNLSYRRTTHRAQQNNRSTETKAVDVLSYLNQLNKTASEFDEELFLQMDETPIYFDGLEQRTVDEKSAKSVEVLNTGNDKSRFTLCITVSSSGNMLPGYIIWKGLKHIPAVFKTHPIPENIVMTCSESGSMDSNLMHDYLERIVQPYLNKRKGCLLMDEHTAHFTSSVKQHCLDNDITTESIPAGYTHSCQPVDVAINAQIKAYYLQHWQEFMANESQVKLTTGGNRKKPGYEIVANWISDCLRRIDSSTIKKGFQICGLYKSPSPYNGLSFVSNLNGRLKDLVFINKDNTCYEQYMMLCMLITYDFKTVDGLLNKIQEYIVTFKKFHKKKFEERMEVDESPEIVFDEEANEATLEKENEKEIDE